MQYIKFFKIALTVILISASCYFILSFGAGTLGGFETRSFLISKKKLETSMDTLLTLHPEYKIPVKWLPFDDWSKRGYDFLRSRIFYFGLPPEEMYYVTFVEDYASPADTYKATIAIRSVFNGGNHVRWLLEKDFDSNEKKRIEERFNNEIISKLEIYTKTKAKKE